MHDHSEPSQVANGGNYNCGLISGIVFTGDRKGARPGQAAKVLTFPDRPTTGDPMTWWPMVRICSRAERRLDRRPRRSRCRRSP